MAIDSDREFFTNFLVNIIIYCINKDDFSDEEDIVKSLDGNEILKRQEESDTEEIVDKISLMSEDRIQVHFENYKLTKSYYCIDREYSRVTLML